MLNTVLILNNTIKPCGVQQWGERLGRALRNSIKYNFVYKEVQSEHEAEQIIRTVEPSIVLYNYHPGTMNFISNNLTKKFSFYKHAAIIHEGYFHKNNYVGFDYFIYFSRDINIEPENERKIFIITTRYLLSYTGSYPINEVPTIGSFGFAFPNKKYEDIVKVVNEEFDVADIKFYMAKYTRSDMGEKMAKDVISKCKKNMIKPGINLYINREFLSEEDVLKALAANDINCFFYVASKTEGLPSSIDFALSVNRPIAITKVPIFSQLYTLVPSICIENSTLKKIIKRGTKPLKPLYNLYTNDNFISEFESFCDNISLQII